MKSLLNIIFCVAVVAFQEGRSKRVKRLSGSVYIEPHRFPYNVFIKYLEKPRCGGALVDEQHLITAAHCFCHGGGEPISDLNNFTIVAGSKDLADPKSGITTGVKRVVKEPFRLSDSIKPIKLPVPYQEYCVGTLLAITGYGSETPGGPYSNYLKLSLTNIISQEQCKELMPDSHLGSATLCTKSRDESRVCDYDNGSPLVNTFTKLGKVIVGLLSIGDPDSCVESPDIYTKVSHHLDFIRTGILSM
ncbi:hypothetical protein QAD02_010470 [Eretmocerus hayati]|uniref:Uncharacterized protein n=1 Tax=Eretmocerus hayati TaxID=131215 RepID=A0ACC2NUB2_9HYME|nr:hypothetical protein QAD02_010470 [Eretmocerus hayati]